MNQSPRVLEAGVILLQIILCQLVQWDVSDVRNDVVIDTNLIGCLCGTLDLRLGVILISVVYPFPEGHTRRDFFGFGAPAQLILKPLQLLQTFCLGFCQDIFGFGIAVFIVADNDAALPSSILSQVDAAFSGFSFSCHGFSSSPKMSVMKEPTTSAARFCISPVTWV